MEADERRKRRERAVGHGGSGVVPVELRKLGSGYDIASYATS